MRFLGLALETSSKGRVEIRLPFREEFLRADGSDWLHGGVVSALIDIAGDYAVSPRSAPACRRFPVRAASRTALLMRRVRDAYPQVAPKRLLAKRAGWRCASSTR